MDKKIEKNGQEANGKLSDRNRGLVKMDQMRGSDRSPHNDNLSPTYQDNNI